MVLLLSKMLKIDVIINQQSNLYIVRNNKLKSKFIIKMYIQFIFIFFFFFKKKKNYFFFKYFLI